MKFNQKSQETALNSIQNGLNHFILKTSLDLKIS